MFSTFDFPEVQQYLFQDPATSTMYFIIGSHNTVMFFLFIIVGLVIVLMIYIVAEAQPFMFSTQDSQLNELPFSFFLNPLNLLRYIFGLTTLRQQKLSSVPMSKLVNLHFVSNRIQKWYEENLLETFWTEYPTVLVAILVIPVLIFLFAFEEVETGQWDFVIKVIGNQWYWTYELVVLNGVYDWLTASNLELSISQPKLINFESRVIMEADLQPGQFRLLDVDNVLVLPIHTPIHVYVTSSDVIHSWSVPSLGVKIDAVPGRINATSFTLTRPGVFYGQCSELCGVNHYAMPIQIIGIVKNDHAFNV